MILLTGATGKIGRNLATILGERGVPTRALVRDTTKAADIAAAGVELIQGELTPADLDRALTGVDTVYLAVGGTPDQVALENAVIDGAARAGVRRIVKISVNGADPAAPVILARWHGEIEQHIAASAVPATILRPNFFMQNFLGSAGSIAGEGNLYGASDDGRVAFIDDRDIAAVVANVLVGDGHDGKDYVLSGPDALSYPEVASAISSATGKPVTYVNLTDDQMREALLGMQLPQWLADAYIDLNLIIRNNWAAEPIGDTERLLGRAPRSFADFARENAKTFSG